MLQSFCHQKVECLQLHSLKYWSLIYCQTSNCGSPFHCPSHSPFAAWTIMSLIMAHRYSEQFMLMQNIKLVHSTTVQQNNSGALIRRSLQPVTEQNNKPKKQNVIYQLLYSSLPPVTSIKCMYTSSSPGRKVLHCLLLC